MRHHRQKCKSRRNEDGKKTMILMEEKGMEMDADDKRMEDEINGIHK